MGELNAQTVREVGKAFCLAGEMKEYAPVKTGNINTTLRVKYQDCGSEKEYIFQRINTFVFKKPEELMDNIRRVNGYIEKNFPQEKVLRFYETEDGRNFIYDKENAFWRVTDYLPHKKTDEHISLEMITNTGYAFGHFQMLLAGFDGSTLYETIPDFHNTRARMDKLAQDVKDDPAGRVEQVRDIIDFLGSVEGKACELSVKQAEGRLPIRVTHNDTKSNNVLFDIGTGKPLVVIDLDTIMPGLPMFDFGDAIRFIANTAAEDDPDLEKVRLDMSRFKAFTEGFIGQVAPALSSEEIDSMVLGAFSMTVELTARFLDDYLCGDKYFKIDYPDHNLVRTRNQMKLAQEMLSHWDEMEKIVRDVAGRIKAGS